MRLFLFSLLVAGSVAFAQNAESDQRVQQTLISEIQQLRLAIERSTLLNARTQLAISQLQLQETSVSRLTQQLNDVRSSAASMQARKARLEEELKQMEDNRSTPAMQAQHTPAQIEGMLKQLRLELQEAAAIEQNRAARESDLTLQLQTAQNQIADSRSRIAEMERALDAAIQQLLKPH